MLSFVVIVLIGNDPWLLPIRFRKLIQWYSPSEKYGSFKTIIFLALSNDPYFGKLRTLLCKL